MGKMRPSVKVLTVVFDLSKGGAERAAAVFAAGYARIGTPSAVLAFGESQVRAEYLLAAGVRVIYGREDDWQQQISDWCPTVVHLHSHGLEADWVDAISAACPNACYVETNVFSRPSSWENKLDASFQLGEHAAKLYRSRGGDSNIVRIMPYPMDIEDFKPLLSGRHLQETRNDLGIKSGAVVVGRVGQSYMGKWSHQYISCFQEILAEIPEAEFLLVNPPEILLHELMLSTNLRRRIHVIPETFRDSDLRKIYATMDVMLHIADQGESFGYSIVESISVGTPVVTLSTPWGDNTQVELVSTGATGVVVHRSETIVGAVVWACLREWDSDYMHASVRARFASEVLSRQVLEFLQGQRSLASGRERTHLESRSFDRKPLLAHISDWLLTTSRFRWLRKPINRFLRGQSIT